ncbi:MAG: hypothetical protein ACR2HG_15390 [Pyrinomonadaceae bacterium]
MSKIILIFLGLIFWTCGHGASPTSPTKSSVQTNSDNLKPAPTPTTVSSVSECTRQRAVGLPNGVNIPQELCFDDTKPVDAKEKSNAKVGNSPQSAEIQDTDLAFEKLPPEVRRIVRLTAPEMDVNAVVFDLTIIPTPDERSNNRLVKSYSYHSSSKNNLTGKDVNSHNWLFERQNNLLKLVSAEIDMTR